MERRQKKMRRQGKQVTNPSGNPVVFIKMKKTRATNSHSVASGPPVQYNTGERVIPLC